MSNKTEKETSQQQNSKAQQLKTIDPTPTKMTQNQPQNKKQTQTKTNIQQKPKEGKVQQSHKEVEKKEQKQKQQPKTKEQIIKQYIATHKIQIANDQISEFIEQESAKTTAFEPNNLHLWIQAHKKDKKPQEQSKEQQNKPKTQIPSEKQNKNEEKKPQEQPKEQQTKPKTQISSQKQAKNEEKKTQQQPKQQQQKPKTQIPSEMQSKNEEKKSEDKVQLTNKQIINNFLQKQAVEQIKQIQPDLIEIFNKQMSSKLEINSQKINVFFKSGSNKNYESFKQWLIKHDQTLISQWHKKIQKSVIAKQIETHLTKLKSIVDLADQNKSNLNINIGAGENKGKTSLKIGMLLRQSQQSKFHISIQVKIKKKVQLKQFIQNQIKKMNKTDDQGLYKFSKIKFEQTQKSLTIHLSSQVFQKYLLKGFIEFLQKKFSNEKPPILQAQLQVNIKNSIKQDENLLHNKRFIKWLAQGFTKSIKIEGNNKVAQHFSSPLAQYFPIFKVVRSGDVLLKLKKIQNVDKLFDKLGINQICQQTPTLQKYLQVMVKQHLDSKIVLWVGDIIKYVILFACSIPNQRISIHTNISISHLLLYLNISAQACKELGQIVTKTNVEQLS